MEKEIRLLELYSTFIRGGTVSKSEAANKYEVNDANINLFQSKKPVVKVKKAKYFSAISKEYSGTTVTYKNGDITLTSSEMQDFRNKVKSHIQNKGAVWVAINDKYFNVKTNTLFDNTKIELRKWFAAIWLVTSHKKGISSLQLSRDIDVTQKTAWFMLQRIRNCFCIENNNELSNTVELDETYMGVCL